MTVLKPEEPNGLVLIWQERDRQRKPLDEGGEDFDAAHDAGHVSGELAMAAACYAAGSCGTAVLIGDLNEEEGYTTRTAWPWDVEDDKRTRDDLTLMVIMPPTVQARIRLLAKAGALVAAEIDRLLEED
jgi:hypothetical protein